MTSKKKLHFIGIGGIGMSALALLALEKGYQVTGSDIASGALLEKLRRSGAQVFVGHSGENVAQDAIVIYTTDVKKDNVEYRKAIELRLPLWHRSELLAFFLKDKQSLLVAGSHGKTTTSSLLAHVLEHIGARPSYIIGGIAKSLGTNGKWGDGLHFVAEADESDGTFLKYSGYGAILTNIGSDHLSYWRNQNALCLGFQNFAKQVISKGHLFWCCDSEQLSSAKIEGYSYGFSPHADLKISDYVQDGWVIRFNVGFLGKSFSGIEVPLIGKHNASNAAAVFGLLLSLGFSEGEIRKGFLTFEGVGRRAERKGGAKGIDVYDDYAHHPNEITATVEAMKKAAVQRRLVIVFQPHRYTRTRDCLEDFAKAFQEADELVITDIYSAGEQPIENVSTEKLIQRVIAGRSKPVHYAPKVEIVPFLRNFLRANDFVVTMGAGDITKLGPELLKELES